MKTELTREPESSGAKVQYDEQVKKILANKTILAWVLQYTVQEFRELTIEEIVPCIEGEPEISSVKVNPGETNEKITGSTNEDKVPNEGAIYYDIRFSACSPANGEQIRVLLNVEAQKSFYPGYHIVTRGVFYGARMISAQLGTEFAVPDYDGIKKVYSIWICMNAPKYIGNAISEYSFGKKDLVPGIPDDPETYDKMSVIQICLNENAEEGNALLGMLNTVFSPRIPADEKVKRLEEDYKIPAENGLGKELEIMCNVSDYVFETGMQEGMEKGMEKGMNLSACIYRLVIDNPKWSDEQIAKAADCEVEKVKAVKKMFRL